METAIDTSTQRETRKYGWSTNAKTRPIMLFSAMEALMKGWITQYDDRQKREMLTFVTID